MSLISLRSHLHLTPLAFGLLALAFVTTALAFPVGDSVSQSADAHAAGYASRARRPENTTGDHTSFNAMGAANESASGAEASNDGDFPWMVSLLILGGGLVATAIAFIVTGRRKPRHPGRGTKL